MKDAGDRLRPRRLTRRRPAATLLLAIALAVAWTSAAEPQRNTDRGIAVELGTGALKEGTTAEVEFRLSDTATGAPLTGARPAAWLALQHEGRDRNCTQQAAKYLGGDLFGRADVDLNNYYVLSLNEDASVSVVDPLFSFGGSKLLAMLALEGRGEDWALTPDQSTLFVSMPKANAVAIADTRRWVVSRNVATGPNPRRIALGEALWVADDEGVTAVDPRSFAPKQIRFGRAHDLVLSGDGRRLFAATDGAVVVIDAHARSIVGRVAVDGTPSLLAWSPASALAYAADPATGRIFAIDAERGLAATIEARPGMAQIRFAPNGRHAVIANPEQDLVQVLDAATHRIVQNGAIDGGPDRIAFSDLLVYVRRRASETVLMITLDQIGAEGRSLSIADFPGGQHPFGEGPQSLADTIVPSPEVPSVLVANGADKMIYLYKEGMAAPAGGFSTYGRQPRAVLVVDRGLRESQPGRYATTVPLSKPGRYDVVFFLNAPRVVTCFAVTIEPREGAVVRPATRVSAIDPPSTLAAGQRARLRFALTDPTGKQPRNASDVRALAFEAPGVWQQRGEVRHRRDGLYELTFTPPAPGIYYVWLESESLGLPPNNNHFFVYEAK